MAESGTAGTRNANEINVLHQIAMLGTAIALR
jgi:hypothetical protein